MALNGILLVDKQGGWTSHDVVAKARRLTGQRKIGHTGTLDPMATGLLVLCLGSATRLVEYMVSHDKHYEGLIALGATTATDDAEGEILASRPVPVLSDERLRELERGFMGELQQRPPAYSAVKVAGQRAYAVARRGGVPVLAERRVAVHDVRLEPAGPGHLLVRVHCGPGTYVRSLARDIGEAIGCGAHLAALRRTASGSFRVESAVTLQELETLAQAGLVEEVILAPDEGLAGSGAAIVTVERGQRLRHGVTLPPVARESWPAAAARVYDAGGSFLGVTRVDESGRIWPLKMLPD
ncbi:MAG: tRNA pseudouridine(55) synthase TruB [Dehalococcoidia bacterium]|nr:tRNA pseudouridine(55) synthase TruB [Dehalococcoidia bacterium]